MYIIKSLLKKEIYMKYMQLLVDDKVILYCNNNEITILLYNGED